MFNLEMVRSVADNLLHIVRPYGERANIPPFLTQAHFIVDEMLMNGCIVETNKQNVLAPVQLLDKA